MRAISRDHLPTGAKPGLTRAPMPDGVVHLSPLDARVLRAVCPLRERTAARVAELAGCREELAASSLRRLRARMLVEPDGRRPSGWLRTHRGDLILEHQP